MARPRARTSTRTPKKPPPKDSIRIKLGYSGGPWNHEEMHAMLLHGLDEARAAGIKNYRPRQSVPEPL